jgi:hypothetical protein
MTWFTILERNSRYKEFILGSGNHERLGMTGRKLRVSVAQNMDKRT